MIEKGISPAARQALVVVVEMEIDPRHYRDFMALLKRNAENSRTSEEGCLIFDVCIPEEVPQPPTVLLYELYSSSEAFDLHLQTEHFKEFDRLSRHMVRAKTVHRYRLESAD